MGKRSQTWNKPISRRMLEKKLNEVVDISANKPVAKVIVYLVFDFDVHVPKVFVSEFYGSDMKNNLFCYLMDKSFTSRIVDIRTGKLMGLLHLRITLFSQDEKPLKRTNIDGKTMMMLGKVRYAS